MPMSPISPANLGGEDFMTPSQTDQNQKGRATPVPSVRMS
jgi:hypothetical protein